MELWIRSQDEQVLKLAEHFDIYTGGYDGKEYYVIEESGTDVAQYKTKERALEVLDEIQNKIKTLLYLKPKVLLKPEELISAKKYFEELNEQEFIICDKHFEIVPFSNNVVFYNMPKE